MLSSWWAIALASTWGSGTLRTRSKQCITHPASQLLSFGGALRKQQRSCLPQDNICVFKTLVSDDKARKSSCHVGKLVDLWAKPTLPGFLKLPLIWTLSGTNHYLPTWWTEMHRSSKTKELEAREVVKVDKSEIALSTHGCILGHGGKALAFGLRPNVAIHCSPSTVYLIAEPTIWCSDSTRKAGFSLYEPALKWTTK